MPAGIEATGKRAHGIGNSTAVEAGLCDPDIVRHELQFRLRQRRAGQGSHRPLAEPLVDGILPDPRRVHQGHEFGTLQVDVDVAATGYADVQKRCTRYERLRARQSDEDLFAQLADEFVGFTRIRGVDVNARRVRAVGIQVIAVDARAGLTVDVGLEAADYFGDEFVFDRPERYALWHAEEHLDAVGIRLRQEVEFRREEPCKQRRQRDQRDDPRAATSRRGRQPHDRRRRLVPDVLEPIDRHLAGAEVLAGNGKHRDGSYHGHGDGDGQRQREVGEQLSFQPLHEQDRQEDGDTGHRRCEQCADDLRWSFSGSLRGWHPALAQANDILLDDDRGIEYESDGERESRQRYDVEAAAEGAQRKQRRQQRERDRQRNKQGRAPAAQEAPQHAECEHYAEHEIAIDQGDRATDVYRGVEAQDDLQVGVGERTGVQFVDHRVNIVENSDGVGTVLALHLDVVRRISGAVHEAAARVKFGGDFGHVAQANGLAAAAGDDQVAEFFRIESAQEPHRVLAAADARKPTSGVDGAPHRVGDIRHLHAERGGTIGVEADQHHAIAFAAKVYALHAVNCQQAWFNLGIDNTLEVRDVGTGPRYSRVHEQCCDRKVPAAYLDFGFAGVGRCCLDVIQRIEDVEHRLLQVGTDVEAEVHVAVSGPHVARHLDHARYLPKRILLGLDDTGFDLLRRRVAPGGIDVNLRILEVRQHLDRQRSDTGQSQHEQQHGRSEQRGRVIRGNTNQ